MHGSTSMGSSSMMPLLSSGGEDALSLLPLAFVDLALPLSTLRGFLGGGGGLQLSSSSPSSDSSYLAVRLHFRAARAGGFRSSSLVALDLSAGGLLSSSSDDMVESCLRREHFTTRLVNLLSLFCEKYLTLSIFRGHIFPFRTLSDQEGG
jgi:hypothetical protein